MNVSDLKKTALIYWPVELAEKEKLSSIIPLLIRTQESFISILRIASKDPFSWITALDLCDELYPNLFLKHLCVLSDIGGENLKRFSSELSRDFYSKDFNMEYAPFMVRDTYFDSMVLYYPDEMTGSMRKIQSVLTDLFGTLEFDYPKNKSGLKKKEYLLKVVVYKK